MQVHEIFQSISGEVGAIPQGSIAWFIRFQGCSLACSWCDAPKAQNLNEGTVYSPQEILDKLPWYSTNVVLTGGEPYVQNPNELTELVFLLHQNGSRVQIETNGKHIPYLDIPHIIDYKTPSSGMQDYMIGLRAYANLPRKSWIKFVIKDWEDAQFSLDKLIRLRPYIINKPIRIGFSTEDGGLIETLIQELNTMGEWFTNIVTFNMQIHKFLNLA